MFYPFIFLIREMIEGLYCFCCISQSFKELIFLFAITIVMKASAKIRGLF